MTSVVNRYYDSATDQFLSIDPAVTSTNQPYVFTNDDPLNAEDPLGLIPQLAGQETDEQITNVGLTYQITADSNDLIALQSMGNSVQADYEAFQNAMAWGAKDWYRLQQKYDRALKRYAEVGLPIAASLGSAVYTFYSVTSSFLTARARNADYAAAQDAVDAYEGTNPIVVAELEATADTALEASVAASVDLVGAGIDAAAGGSLFSSFWAALLLLFE